MPNISLVNQFMATRMFFVGEDPVTCTGFDADDADRLQLRLARRRPAVNDPVYHGRDDAARHAVPARLHQDREAGRNANVWTDVTMEILNLGFTGRNQEGGLCADPTPTR